VRDSALAAALHSLELFIDRDATNASFKMSFFVQNEFAVSVFLDCCCFLGFFYTESCCSIH